MAIHVESPAKPSGLRHEARQDVEVASLRKHRHRIAAERLDAGTRWPYTRQPGIGIRLAMPQCQELRTMIRWLLAWGLLATAGVVRAEDPDVVLFNGKIVTVDA